MEGFRDRFNARRSPSPVDPMPHELANPDYRPLTLREQIQNAIRSEMSIVAQDRGLETFEEADDFEEEDPEEQLSTIYEQVLMTDESAESLDGSESVDDAPTPDEPPDPPVEPPVDAPAAT